MDTFAAQAQPPSGNAELADRYRVLARVGVGGTATVFRCIDMHTDRVVAVKVLRTNGSIIPEAEARFHREARLAARLSHPHIVRVLDFGYTIPPVLTSSVWPDDADRPVPYIAMEYVFGKTLKDLVRRLGPLPLEWVWQLGDQLCQALAAAHADGVVHRDVKPQNVMIVDSPYELLSKLTDFGIARQVGSDLTTLTVSGQVIGTPDYLSPEQVSGEPGGPTSDLYALGVVLFELVTGRLPFIADTPLAAASLRMTSDPPLPSKYRQDLPLPLQEVILLALHRHAVDRFADAVEFAQALRWSKERSPHRSGPLPRRGEWVAGVPGDMKPAVGAQARVPVDAGEDEVEGDQFQSTVLRVAPLPVDDSSWQPDTQDQ